MLRSAVAAVACAAWSGVALVSADDFLFVDPKTQGANPDRFYAMFLESEINFGGEGGLYAELISNRDLETLGRGRLSHGPPTRAEQAEYDRRKNMSRAELKRYMADGPILAPGLDPHEPPAIPTDFRPWFTLSATTTLEVADDAPFYTNPHSLLATSDQVGAFSNPGYWGINVRKGMAYPLSMFLKLKAGSSAPTIYAQLTCDGKVAARSSDVFTPGMEWTKQNTTLRATRSCSDGQFNVYMLGSGAVMFDHVSLFPGDAVEGLFRKDVFDYVKAFAPPQLRIPGGSYLEGSGPRTRWAWKNTIGPREQRKGHYNSVWGYWVTDALGIAELLKFTNALGTKPILCLYTGYSLFNKYIPLNESGYIRDEAVELVQFCNGGATTTWGMRRVEAGIPQPVGVDTLEVGNEEMTMGKNGYQGHYELITKAIWKDSPDMQMISTGTGGIQLWPNRSASCNPCIGGCGYEPQRCAFWDEHSYDSPNAMVNLSTIYDDYYSSSFCHTTEGKTCPPLVVLEYGAWGFGMNATCAEAFFLLGLERTGYVHSTAPAPLFNNLKGQNWGQNLINFNSSAIFATPAFYAQRLLKKYIGAQRVASTRVGDNQPKEWNGHVTMSGANRLHVRLVNYRNTSAVIEVLFNSRYKGLNVSTTAEAMYGADPTGVKGNTLDEPHAYVVRSATMPKALDNVVRVAMPAFSIYAFNATFNSARTVLDEDLY